ncbi:MAG: signal peptidase II [Patescibacteria group bacterium]|nr:signal peptidase II [Patescibacteria group bacterium]
MLKYKKNMAFWILLAMFFVVLDRFFKFLATSGFFDKSIPVAGDFFKLGFAPNYNIAFSLPFSGIFLNILIIMIIIFLLYELLFLAERQEWSKVAFLTFIIFGAISNMLDRLKYGFVVDYLDLKYFTVFNIADVMIVGGVSGLILIFYKNKKDV